MIHQQHRFPLSLVPFSSVGRGSLGLAVVSLVSLMVFYLMCATGQRGGEGFFDNWFLAGPILVVAVTGIAGLVSGCFAVLRRHERGLLVAIPIAWGLLVALFAFGELSPNH